MKRPVEFVCRGRWSKPALEVEGLLEAGGAWQITGLSSRPRQACCNSRGAEGQGLVMGQQPETAQMVVLLLVAQTHRTTSQWASRTTKIRSARARHIVGKSRFVIIVPDQDRSASQYSSNLSSIARLFVIPMSLWPPRPPDPSSGPTKRF